MFHLKKGLNDLHQKSILNTTRKKLLVYTIISYYPAITLIAGSPYPDMLQQVSFPFSLFQLDETFVKLIETASTTLGLIGSVSVGVFWIHKQSNNKHKETNDRITEVETNLKKEMNTGFKDLENKIEEKDRHQTQIFDQKILGNSIEIGNLKESDKEIKEDIKNIEYNLFHNTGSAAASRTRGIGGNRE